jgi:hypothetical protein
MFGVDFYPTPSPIADLLAQRVKDLNAPLLEPSAGKGDLLVALAKRWNAGKWEREQTPNPINFHAIEIDGNLRSILSQNGWLLVWDDFLTFNPTRRYQTIVMNPPFSDLYDHLLHAWQILADGGQLIAIVPETFATNSSQKAQACRDLAVLYGFTEQLGSVFADAERKTEVGILYLELNKPQKPEYDGLNFKTRNDGFAGEPNFGEENTEVALAGYLNQILSQYQAAVGALEDYIRARVHLERYSSFFDGHPSGLVKVVLSGSESGSPNQRWNAVYSNLTTVAWEMVLGHPGFKSLMTNRARQMFDAFKDKQSRLEFNEYNIRQMFDALEAQRDDLLRATIVDAFDYLTTYHENREPGEKGWKSNSSWKVRKRVVVPYFLDNICDSINYREAEKIRDVERALCLLSGQSFDDITSVTNRYDWHKEPEKRICKQNSGKLFVATFFEFRWYYGAKTGHLYFRDLELLKQFNLAAAQAKNWLPGTEWSW